MYPWVATLQVLRSRTLFLAMRRLSEPAWHWQEQLSFSSSTSIQQEESERETREHHYTTAAGGHRFGLIVACRLMSDFVCQTERVEI